jgi:hypothetical protein
MVNGKKGIVIILLSLIVVSGCETGRNYKTKVPVGFAEYTKEKSSFKVISSEGVRVRIYSIDNRPYGDMNMWKGAVSHYLKGRGYRVGSQREIVALNNLRGHYTEYLYRYNGEDYIYALTLFVDRDTIYVIEAGGIDSYYKKRRNAIEKIISDFRVNR